MINPAQYYLDTFRVTVKDLEDFIAQALSGGGDWADLYFENSSFSDLFLRDGEVSAGGFHVDYGVGIRVLSGERTGYAYTESTAPADIRSAALAASAIGHGSVKIPSVASLEDGYVPRLYRGKPNPAADRYPIIKDWRETTASQFVPVLEALRDKVLAKDSRIVKISAILQTQVSDIMMFNSFSELKYDTRPMGTIALSARFSDGKETRSNHVSRSFRMGAEMITDALLDELADQIVRGMDDRFAAKRPKGGRMDVVMGAGASGILLHEAMGHAFEADFNRKGQSIFSGSLGKKVCAEGINIVDDGTIRGNRGSINFDDEGVPAQRTYMVENGILTSFLHDRISAKHYGVPSTGNGRRESFRCNPIPRMRATYMEGGNAAPEDIIASVKNGIYVDEFSNGQVKIGEGDFTFFVKSGHLIENGKLTMPISDINVIGNGPEALAQIVAVGNDPMIDDGAWTCGKEQMVPVSCGIPTVLVKNLTVGGE
ncbi:MAG: TldD/PmbA family protein [Bacteroidales bacterium]|nr:TldD/PmbA family protein [Bacteroidales bacterium]